MEVCLMKPEEKKPKPIRRIENDCSRPEKTTPVERPVPLERKAPVVPQRPTDAELSHAQNRMKRPVLTLTEINGNLKQESKEKQSGFPVIPPRPTEQELNTPKHYSQRRRDNVQSAKETDRTTSADAPTEEVDFRQANLSGLTEMKSQKEKAPSLTEKMKFTNLFKKPQKPAEGATTDKEKKGGVAGIFKRSASIDNLFDSEDSLEEKPLSSSCDNLTEATTAKEKTGGFTGMFKKSPKPCPSSPVNKDPLSDRQFLYGSCDSIPDLSEENWTASNDDLSIKEENTLCAGMFKRTPKTTEKQVVSFRIKKTLPRIPKIPLQKGADKMPITDETVELPELSPAQEVHLVEMAAYPSEDNPLEIEQENDELMEWWITVAGWAEWTETSNQEDNEEVAIEEAADRVYMAARLFVQLFNQRGASLQRRILELLALADSADNFHKRTVMAAVGGGVASVCGSVATITGLILAPVTFGASIIVTAVGIGVATAGSIASATANITDTVHSKTDRKNMEKMILGYQEEIKDIRECLEFVQEGMDTLQEWDFEKYTESAAKKALNHNIKHVMKEGGRAGKALMINTDRLISTVKVLGAAGGAAKAVKAISATTAIMSTLFLALDVFFLAKDSHELRKGAKTKFATKIREVCRDLQDGLLELNKVKAQLQKTMDSIEVEEEIQEVEEDLESDPVKLAELEQELDLLEEKLDKKVEGERKRREEEEKAAKKKIAEDEEIRASDGKIVKSEKETKIFDEEKLEQSIYRVKESIKELFKDPLLKTTQKAKELENKLTADEEKSENKLVLCEKMHKKEASMSGKGLLEAKSKDTKQDEEKVEKRKSQMAKQKETTKEEKVKGPRENQMSEEEATKEEEKVKGKSQREDKGVNQEDKKVKQKSVGESHMAKQEEMSKEEKVQVKSSMESKTTKGEEKVKSQRERNVVNQQQSTTKEDGKVSVKSLRQRYMTKEETTKEEEKVNVKSPRVSRKVEEREIREKPQWRSEKRDMKYKSRSEAETERTGRHSSSRSGSYRSSVRRERSRHEETKEERGVMDWRAEVTREKTKDERKESHLSHYKSGPRRERSDREARSSREETDVKRSHYRTENEERSEEEKQGSSVERRDEQEEEERRKIRKEREKRRSLRERDGDRESGRSHRESGWDHIESGRDHLESGRSHMESGRDHMESGRDHRESGRSHMENGRDHMESGRSHKESDRRHEHWRPRSNALLEDGLYI